MATRLLFVDDEASIRKTLELILDQHGFTVTTSATVRDALQLINHETFDVLISDLNIGQPGDGFTVVSAMRRVQILIPHCRPSATRWMTTCSSRPTFPR
jgi:DNA-binding NtrC family response regulator